MTQLSTVLEDALAASERAHNGLAAPDRLQSLVRGQRRRVAATKASVATAACVALAAGTAGVVRAAQHNAPALTTTPAVSSANPVPTSATSLDSSTPTPTPTEATTSPSAQVSSDATAPVVVTPEETTAPTTPRPPMTVAEFCAQVPAVTDYVARTGVGSETIYAYPDPSRDAGPFCSVGASATQYLVVSYRYGGSCPAGEQWSVSNFDNGSSRSRALSACIGGYALNVYEYAEGTQLVWTEDEAKQLGDASRAMANEIDRLPWE